MLAHAKMRGLPLETYLERDHPIQQDILTAFAEMCDIDRDKIELGTDGCSAPNFAVPLQNAALGFARLCDPSSLPKARADACRKITSAMTSYSEMVSGFAEFDCELMRAGDGKILTKRGAEGFQAIGILPGAIRAESHGLGVAFKVSDGDASRLGGDLSSHNRVRPAVTLEILRQLGALNGSQMKKLAEFGPILPIRNYRGIVVGESRPVFKLQ